MDPALCDSVLGIDDSRELLDRIEKRNLFVTRVEGQETWYKYHHLFQEFLQTRLDNKTHKSTPGFTCKQRSISKPAGTR